MLQKRVQIFSIGKGETPLLRMELILLYPRKLRIIKFVFFLFISNSTYKHIKILIFRERKKMMKKEEAKEKEGGKGGENSVKQGGKELEPGWRSRKNREIREGKIGS